MIKNQNIMCISSIDWDFNRQGHQEIMIALAKAGNRVLFIENTGVRSPTFRDFGRLKKRVINWYKSTKGFKKAMDNLYIYSPVILPFPYSRFARWVNKYLLILPLRRWMKAAGFYEPIIWTFLPTGTALDIVNNIDKKLVVYHCLADFYELADDSKKVKKTEDTLIMLSDLIFAQGSALKKKCSRLNNNVHIFPFGVNIENFENFRFDHDAIPQDLRKIKRPIIGYIGGVHKHIDFALIKFISGTLKDCSLVLVGPVQADISSINKLPNIFILGKKEFSELPNYLHEFNVGIIPYKKSAYTETVFPAKLNEYFSMGKPVVSTDLAEVIKFSSENNNLVLIARSHQEFTDFISLSLKEENPQFISQRKGLARMNSWGVRIKKMSDLIEEALKIKMAQPLNWQEKFLQFYRAGRRNTVRAGIFAICAYLLLFHTPLIWFAASPLKIAQPPEKTDCIVVFAAGVGESGKAGQGYEERVEYAVDLYNRGYSKNLIFSSGYKYYFNEARMMRILAVSLGVPESAVILEEESRNTADNVKFTKKILENNNWHSILLVSSPYHMRRASLVFRKLNDTRVIYTPIPESLFYNRKDGVRLEHIRGIMHEYLGIIYYWWKGYI